MHPLATNAPNLPRRGTKAVGPRRELSSERHARTCRCLASSSILGDSPICELSIIDLACHDGGHGRPDPVQERQVKALLLGRRTGRRRLVALAFDCHKLLLHQRQPLNLPYDLPGESWRQRSPLSGYELADVQALVFASHVNAANALGEQQTLDAVDVRRPLLHQPATFAMRAPEILLVDTGNAHDRPDVALAPAPGDQRT